MTSSATAGKRAGHGDEPSPSESHAGGRASRTPGSTKMFRNSGAQFRRAVDSGGARPCEDLQVRAGGGSLSTSGSGRSSARISSIGPLSSKAAVGQRPRQEAARLVRPQHRVVAVQRAAARRACLARRCGPARARSGGPCARWWRAGARSRSRSCLPSGRAAGPGSRARPRCRAPSGFVEHQDRRVLQHHARDRDALALPARELDAALAHVRLVAGAALPVLQVEDELVRLRLARRGLDLRRAWRPGRP